jgi:pimeloyl-ACP methyl ester carboxylesterase
MSPDGGSPSGLRWLRDAGLTAVEAVAGSWFRPRAAGSLARRGREVGYLAAGDGGARRVIFVHGSPGEAEEWRHLLLDVPPGLEYVAVDRPGFGRSGREAVVGLDRQAARLSELLVTRAGRAPVLVGYSMGGPVAVRMAVDYPDRVAGLVLVGAALDPMLERVTRIQRVAAHPALGRLLPRCLRNANAELMALETELRALAPALGSIRVPVVVLHGDADPLVPFANVDYMRRMLSGSARLTVRRVRGGDHFLPWNRPDVLRDAIARLLAAL